MNANLKNGKVIPRRNVMTVVCLERQHASERLHRRRLDLLKDKQHFQYE